MFFAFLVLYVTHSPEIVWPHPIRPLSKVFRVLSASASVVKTSDPIALPFHLHDIRDRTSRTSLLLRLILFRQLKTLLSHANTVTRILTFRSISQM